MFLSVLFLGCGGVVLVLLVVLVLGVGGCFFFFFSVVGLCDSVCVCFSALEVAKSSKGVATKTVHIHL